MSDPSYKYGYTVGPFYRKFLVGDVGVEVNGDGNGGLNLHTWKCPSEPPWNPTSLMNIRFDSEDQFMEFCTKLLGVDKMSPHPHRGSDREACRGRGNDPEGNT